jgi:hypothetical protein
MAGKGGRRGQGAAMQTARLTVVHITRGTDKQWAIDLRSSLEDIMRTHPNPSHY